MKLIGGWVLGFLLLFAGVAWADVGYPASGEEANGASSPERTVALASGVAAAPEPPPVEEPGFWQTTKVKAWDLLLAVLKGITWFALAIVGLYFILIFMVLFVHITAWFLAQIMGRIVAVGLAVLLVVGCMSLL